MTIPDIIIAVDGYSSTGKSSFAKLLARELGFTYLDSGALYRAVTLFAQEQKMIDNNDNISSELEAKLQGLEFRFNEKGDTCIGNRSIEDEIRSMRVSSQVSPVAAVPYVRKFVDARLHYLASNGRVIMDGRDIGTTVFPDAQLKIFMVASVEVRANRRYAELLAKGCSQSIEEVKRNITERDYLDSHRETSPLRRAKDSFLLDNSDMTMEQEISWAKGLIQGKFSILE